MRHGITHKQRGSAAADADYTEPFGWWGYHWTPARPRNLLWLIEHGSLDVQTAAYLSLAIEARASIIVVAEPHEAGKTTLLTALLDFLPECIDRIYLRGWYERFSFLNDTPSERAYLLCNEISAHLPTYLWGQGVRRIFDAAAAGYPLATTMHAASAEDALRQLTSYPLEVPPALFEAIDVIVTIGVGYVNNRLLRRVIRVEVPRLSDETFRFDILAEREPLRADLKAHVGRQVGHLAELTRCDDGHAASALARRVRELEAWATDGLAQMPSLRDRILDSRATT